MPRFPFTYLEDRAKMHGFAEDFGNTLSTKMPVPLWPCGLFGADLGLFFHATAPCRDLISCVHKKKVCCRDVQRCLQRVGPFVYLYFIFDWSFLFSSPLFSSLWLWQHCVYNHKMKTSREHCSCRQRRDIFTTCGAGIAWKKKKCWKDRMYCPETS